MKSITFLVLLFTVGLHSSSQQFGAFPPSTKWRQLNSDTVRVIYSPAAEAQARRIMLLAHRLAADTIRDLGSRVRKVNIVLHHRTTLANGYVALAPFRSEFYLVPGSNVFDFGNLPWHEILAIHEYRHVHQYNNFKHGASKALSFVFGENGQAFGNALSIPDWFFEGDAVYAETALTTQGRGRLSNFQSGYRSLWLENRKYSWQKLRNGSLKDYVPHHYQLGYLFANYGYLKYGNEFWSRVTRDASAFKGLFYPFQKAIRTHAGISYKTFRKEAFDFYKNQLPADSISQPHHTVISSSPERTVTHYYFPQYIGQDSLLYLKTAYNKIPAFYLKHRSGEEKISLSSVSGEEWFGYRNGKIVYTAYSTHPRWTLVDYSDIVLLDINTRRERRLTSGKRFYTPDISPSGNKIVAVSMNESLETEMQIIDVAKGNSTKTIKHPSYFLLNPRFVDENRVVLATRLPDATMALQILDLVSGEWQQLTPFSSNHVSLPFVDGNNVYFVSNAGGNDDIYRIRLKDRSIEQLTYGATGNYYPSVFRDTLTWSHFTSRGHAIRSTALPSLILGNTNPMQFQETKEIYPVAYTENILGEAVHEKPSEPYKKSAGLLRFHSWLPTYADPEYTISLYSDNILNTFSNELIYRYNENENSHTAGWNTSYGGWYPMLNAGVEYTYKRELPYRNDYLTLNQIEARVGYNIPLNFTKGKTYRLFNGGSNLVFNRVIPTGFYKDTFQSDNRFYLHHFLNWSQYLPRAVQHIYPKFGYTAGVQLRHFLEEDFSFMNKSQWLANAQLFLPSFRNHSLVITGAFQSIDTASTSFSNRFAFSRGYQEYYFRKMWRVSGNYHFPVAYPDFGIASIVYLQRLRANIFYDFTKAYSGYFSHKPTVSKPFRSVGTEIFFDTKWWNQLPVSFGFRVSHLLDDGLTPGEKKGSTWVEFIVPVGLLEN